MPRPPSERPSLGFGTCPTQGMTPIHACTTQVRRRYDSQRHELVLVMRPERPCSRTIPSGPANDSSRGTGGGEDILLQRTPVSTIG